MDQPTARSVALIAVALSHSGRGTAPSQLIAEAAVCAPWILAVPGPAARLILTIEGNSMPITVDSANKVAILTFEDDHNDVVPPPDGALAVAASSDAAVLTVGASVAGTDANGVANLQFPLTPVSAGTSSLSVHATAADGSPLLGPDGVTPIADPAPVSVTVNPGAAAAEMFTVPDA